MKKLFKVLLTMSLMFSLLAVNVSSENSSDLTILFTHDTHDNYEPYMMEINGKVEERGGFARLYSAILEEKKKDAEALLIDGGDYSQGTLFQSIYTTHAPALHLLGMMGYDATTYGNHEFDFRPEGLRDSLQAALDSKEPTVDIVASNTNYDVENQSQALKELSEVAKEYPVVDYKIVEKNGIKVGLFGIMGYEADSNAPMAEAEFLDMIEEAKRVTETLRSEGAEVVIALSHSGTHPDPKKSEDQLMAKAVPDIDVILSAHSHTLLDAPLIEGNTTIISAGRYGENLGKLVIEPEGERWAVKDYEIIPITNKFKDEPKVKAKIEEYKKEVNKEYLSKYNLSFDQVIARSPFNFTSALEVTSGFEEEPIAHLIGDSYIHGVKTAEGDKYEPVDIAVLPSGVLRDSITEGDITVSDAFKILPLGVGKDGKSGYPLISVYLTGKELKLAAEIDASISPIMEFAKLYITGMRYTYNPNRIILNKVTDVEMWDGGSETTEIDDQKLYRVVTDLYTAQMLSVVTDQSYGLLSIVPKDKDGNVVADFEDQIIYNDKNEELKVWVALTDYLQSFDKDKDGISNIDMKYSQQQGYKTIVDEKGLGIMFSNLNGFSLAIIGIILLVIVLVVLLIVFIVKRIKKRKGKNNYQYHNESFKPYRK